MCRFKLGDIVVLTKDKYMFFGNTSVRLSLWQDGEMKHITSDNGEITIPAGVCGEVAWSSELLDGTLGINIDNLEIGEGDNMCAISPVMMPAEILEKIAD